MTASSPKSALRFLYGERLLRFLLFGQHVLGVRYYTGIGLAKARVERPIEPGYRKLATPIDILAPTVPQIVADMRR